MENVQRYSLPNITRRSFLKGAGMLGLAAALPAQKADKTGNTLRPPGAGRDFLSRCIRCGKCVEACPYDSIRLADFTAGKGAFAPYIDPLRTPCFLCREVGPDGEERPVGAYLRCGRACPTGALEMIPNDLEILARLPEEIKTGTAFINREICLAWKFGFCSECYLNCPLKDRALLPKPLDGESYGTGLSPFVDQQACVGCGRCVYVCPVRRPDSASNNRAGETPGYPDQRYGAMVKIILSRSGNDVKLPAIRVQKYGCER